MKLKGIWVAIAVICVAGIGITDYSARHLATDEAQYVLEDTAEKSVSGQADRMPVKTEAGMAGDAGTLGDTGMKEAAGDLVGAEDVSDGTCQKKTEIEETEAAYAFSEQEITADSEEKLAPGGSEISVQADFGNAADGVGMTTEKEETQTETKNGIMVQLAELDAQTEARRIFSSDSSANAMKAAAESERKIWENKLQRILETLEQRLAGDEKITFFTEQRSWVRDRESTAVANSKKQSGSALEELEYIRSLRDLTRERVYALAERYEKILDEAE